jgi:hypothetical protein
MKPCSVCNELKPLSEYSIDNRNTSGLRSICKPCAIKAEIIRYNKKRDRINALAREKNRLNPERTKNHSLKQKFGITLSEYNKMSEQQNHVCAVCGNPETVKRGQKTKTLAVDHCHETNKIRGLLCQKCNQALGLLKENVTTITNLLNYIIKHS